MKTIFAGALCAATFFCAFNSQPAKAADPPLNVPITSCKNIDVGITSVQGFVGDYPHGPAGTPMRQFLGIPYAAPPTDANRWMPPKPFECWHGIRPTQDFGNQDGGGQLCPQGGAHDEDCLYLNVFTKATGIVIKRPVMVFIHGGGLQGGSGTTTANPYKFISKNVVVVTINYRLGALGFLAHPALDSPTLAAHRTGNYGFLDQIAALKWVKTNIAKFGGDPKNVTIFGQSAGGLSVLVHLVSPMSVGLFHKAIIESGSFYNAATPLATAETQGTTFATNVGCNSGTNATKAACLRALPVTTILSNQNVLGNSVRLIKQDGLVINDTLKNLLMTGQFKRIPIINGSTHDETRFHTAGNQTLGTGTTCNFVSNVVPDNQAGSFAGAVTLHDALVANGFSAGFVPTVEAQYPGGATGMSANLAYTNAQTDVVYACRPLRISKWFAQYSSTIYAYEFNDTKAPVYLFPPFTLHDGTTWDYGAYHGAELPFMWPMNLNACGSPVTPLTVVQKQLGNAMITYWTNFAKTGDPNPTTGAIPTNWPQFTANGNMISFAGGRPKLLAASLFDTHHKCSAFWDANSN